MSETQLLIFKNLLRELAELAEHASLTGSMSGGQATAVRRYNQALAVLVDDDVVPEGVFNKLPESTTFDELAVECKLLLASIKGEEDEDRPRFRDRGVGGHGRRRGHGRGRGDFDYHVLMGLAPFTRGEDLAKLVESEIKNGARIPGHVLVALAPFLPGEMITKLVQARLNQVSDRDDEPDDAPPESDDLSPDERTAATTELAQYLQGDSTIDEIMGDGNLPAEAKLELIRMALAKKNGE